MWTEESRGRVAKIARKTTRYPFDLTDEEWERIAALMPKPGRRGRPREVDFREVINAVRYLVRSGCGWRMLPIHFGPWQTVYGWFRELARRFLFQTIHDIELMVLKPVYLHRRWRYGKVGGIHLRQVAIDARVELGHATLHLGRCEVLVAVVHCFELAAVDGDDGIAEQPYLPTQHHELAAYPADRLAVVPPEVSDRFEVGRQSPRQPHQLDITTRLRLQPAARVNAIEIAVDVNLQKDRWMITWPPGHRRHCALEAKIDQIEHVDERIDHANGVIVADEVLKMIGE